MKLEKFAAAAAMGAALIALPVVAAQGSPAVDEEPAGTGISATEQPSTGISVTEQPSTEAIAPARTTPQGSVARSRFTLEVVDREPLDEVTRLENAHDRILFFTELHRFEGQELTHRWEYGGEIKAEVPFAVDGPRWRVYSSKALDATSIGTWTVTVVDAEGNEVARESFDYVPTTDTVTATKSDADATGTATSAQQPDTNPLGDSTSAPQPVADAPSATQPGPAAPAE